MEVGCVHKVEKSPRRQSIPGQIVEVHLRRVELRDRDLDSKVPRAARLGGRVKLRKVEVHPCHFVRVGFVREGDRQVAWASASRRQGCAEDESRGVVGIIVLIFSDVDRVGEVFDVGGSLAHDGRARTHSGPVAIQSIIWVPASHSIYFREGLGFKVH